MAERSVLVRLQANIADFKAQMRQAEEATERLRKKSFENEQQATTTLGRLAQSARQNREAWDDAGTALTAAGAATVAALGATIKAAVDWESAWAGVTKTVDGTPEQLQAVEDGLRGLARTLPATHGEIAAVAEAAGQLGVKTADIVDFTKTMIDLGETTNLTADQAATSLAQLMNVMQTSPEDVGRLGASLVALGNAGASTEADILNMASYLTGAAQLIGASESDVLALSNAMTSMGINAERGGGVMTRVMQDVYAAVQTGGAQLDTFARVAGVSSAEFARSFREDPIAAIDSFVQGLNTVRGSGGNVVATLGELGYVGTQDTAVLLQMAGAGDLLTDSLELGNQAWSENTALLEEAAKRYDTTSSQLAIARNNINDAAIEIGDTFLPVLADLAGGLADVAGWFADLPDGVQGTLGTLTLVGGAAAFAGGSFLLLFPRVMDTVESFRTLQRTSPGVASGIGRVARAAGYLGAAAITLSVFNEQLRALGPPPSTMADTTTALLNMGQTMEDIDALFRAQGSQSDALGAYRIDSLREAAERLTNPTLTDRIGDFFSEVVSLGGNDGNLARERTIDQFNQIGESLSLMVQNGQADTAAALFQQIAEQAEAGGMSIENLRELMPAYVEALDQVNTQQVLTSGSGFDLFGAFESVIARFGTGYESFNTYAEALGLSEDATEDLRERILDLGSTMADFIDPLGAYDGLLEEKRAAEEEAARATAEATADQSDSWEDYVDDVGVSLDEYFARLQEQLTAQNNWQTNMLILAGRVSQGTLDELARLGPEGAELVAQLVNGSDEQLAQLDDIYRQRSQDAVGEWGLVLQQAGPVLAAVAAVAGQGVANSLAAELAAGTTTVADIAAQYGISLANGINPVLQALGSRAVSVVRGVFGFNSADGNLVDYYASGGIEDHVASIAPAGAWRVWAEPETGGEAYIPLSPAKRTRSMSIWRETGRRLGVDVEQYAFGGVRDVRTPRSTAPYGAPISTAGDAAMQKAYDEVTAWLEANTEATANSGGPAGSQAISGGWQSIWNLVKAAIPEARINSTYRPGDPGYHGRGKAIDFGFGSGPGGAGSRGLASIAAFLYTRVGRSLAELIYDGAYDTTPDVKNGIDHVYNAATRAQHANHVHAANFREGGIFNPHIRDFGGPLEPGYTFNGTGGREVVWDNRRYDALDQLMASSAAAGSTVLAEVRVFMDGREITEAVRVEIDGQRAAGRRGALAAAAGGGTLR